MGSKSVIFISLCVVLVLGILLGCTPPAPAEPATPPTTTTPTKVTEYMIPTFIDATDVYAELYNTTVLPATQSAYEGWNTDVGSKIGVKILNKIYDTKYNFSEASSLYDRSVQTDKPIAYNMLVSPGALANRDKFSVNKTPAVIWFSYAAAATPDGWLFAPGRAYPQHYATAIEYLVANDWKNTARKPRIAIATFSGVYSNDLVSTIEPWLKTNDKIEYVGAFFHDGAPVDLTGYVRDLMKAEPDYIQLGTTSVSLTAYYKALEDLGYLHKVTHLHPCYQSLDLAARGVGWDKLEGDFAVAPANAAPGTRAFDWFTKYGDKYYKGATFGSTTVSYAAGTYLLLAAVERAAAKVGADKITGPDIYDAINGQSFTSAELSDVTSDITLIPADRLSGVNTLYMYKAVDGKEVMVGTMPVVEDPILKTWLK